MFKALVWQHRYFAMGGSPIANLDIIKASISEDLSQKASSSLTCVNIPTNVAQNNVVKVYDTRGRFVYWGVIISISNNTIKCNQFQSFFDVNILEVAAYDNEQKALYKNDEISYVMYKTFDLLKDGRISSDHAAYYSGFVDYEFIQTYTFMHLTSFWEYETNERFPYPTESRQVNLEQFLYDTFNTYTRIIKWFPYQATSDIELGILFFQPSEIKNHLVADYGLDYSEKTLFDTYENISNVSITKKDEDINTVHVYSADGSTHRGSYFIGSDGVITQLQSGRTYSTRKNKIKDKIVFDSDNDVMALVNKELPAQQFNHKITFDILFDDRNKFEDYLLGQPIRFYDNAHNSLYNTMLTAWKYEIEENSDVIKKATFTLGKVRVSLTDKINKNRL